MRAARALMFAATARMVVPAIAGTVNWSGYTWLVRSTRSDHAPGNNAWSDSLDNAHVDTKGTLTLAITPDTPRWRCVEIEGPHLGYGRYSFTVATNPGSFDRNVVLGMFTYDDTDDGSYEYREIDIEWSAWNNPNNSQNSWFTVNYPPMPPQSDHEVDGRAPYTTQFTWQAGQIYFSTYDTDNVLLGEHLVKDSVYAPGSETVRLNLWLYDGTPDATPPVDSQPVVAKIHRFSFTPNATYTQPPASNKIINFTNDRSGFTLKRGTTIREDTLQLTPASPYSYAYTGNVFNIQNSSVDIKVTAFEPSAGESSWFMRYDTSNYIRIYAGDGTLYAVLCQNGVSSQNTTPYNATAHRYWRIREASSIIYCEASADRSNWGLIASYPHTLGAKLNTMRIRFECGYWGSNPLPIPMTIAAINTA